MLDVLDAAMTAAWIAPTLGTNPLHGPLLRREWDLPGAVAKAEFRVIGLGTYHLAVNGRPLGDAAIEQPWSQYDTAIYWRRYDATRALRHGKNTIGVALGASFWSVPVPPGGRYYKGDAHPDFSQGEPYLLKFEAIATLDDGRQMRLESDGSWRWTLGPTTLTHLAAGEDYDARLEAPGWDRSGFDDRPWKPVRVVARPAVEEREMDWPPVRVTDVFRPTEIQPWGDDWNVVFPQNASAILRWEVVGAAGAKVTFIPSEARTEQGEIKQLNLGNRTCSYRYTLRGGGPERHQVQFNYHGFQFVRVHGAVPEGRSNPHGLPVLRRIESLHVRTDNPIAGSFTCSLPLFNRTATLIDWAMRSNMNYSFTDCPHREKLGWLEQSYLLAPSFLYRYDVHDWYRKIARDMRDAQQPDGLMRTVAPWYLQLPTDNPFAFTVEWGAAAVLLPWEAYGWYGDRVELARAYPSMRAFVEAVARRSPNGIAPGGLGDWYDYGHGHGPGASRFTPTDLSATASFAMCVRATRDAAIALRHADDAAKWTALGERVRSAFWAKFFDPARGELRHSGSCQASNAMALEADLVPNEWRARLVDQIVADLDRRGGQQTVGDIGHVYFIRALAHAGRSDVLHRVYTRTGTGSYAGILAKGLTTMPESWDAITSGSNSLNHAMLGHVVEWFHGYVGGVRRAAGSVGWDRAIVGPEPGALTSATVVVPTPHGPIRCAWTRRGDRLRVEVEIPIGVEANFVSPWPHPLRARLDGKPIDAEVPFALAPGKRVVVIDRQST